MEGNKSPVFKSIMKNQLTILAHKISSGKGVYALLIGSGVSRAAGIPTGWEITLNLIRKLAAGEGVLINDPKKLEKWYRNEFKAEPNYSDLLDKLCKTPAEINLLLRQFFEPNKNDPKGVKQPTKAHKAIASLVAHGYFKVIITTNFDRLMEKALEKEGISPKVISTESSIEGALPLVHTSCHLIKVNGDYLDGSIKNTKSELEKYSEKLNSHLDKIFDEFGLLVVGWSGKWDIALKDAIMRCKGRRFSTYWILHSKPSESANKIINHTDSETLKAKDANSFFIELKEKVEAIERLQQPHPPPINVPVEETKILPEDPSRRIGLSDFISNATEEALKKLRNNEPESYKELNRLKFISFPSDKGLVNKLESQIHILSQICAIGSIFSNDERSDLFLESIEKIANFRINKSDRTMLYPATFLAYIWGIGALSKKKYHFIRKCLVDIKVKMHRYGKYIKPGYETLHPSFIYFEQSAISDATLSNHLFRKLREIFRTQTIYDENYEDLFEQYEYLSSLLYICNQEKWEKFVVPNCRFKLKSDYHTHYWPKSIQEDINEQGKNWEPYRMGFFGKTVPFEKVKEAVSKMSTIYKN